MESACRELPLMTASKQRNELIRQQAKALSKESPSHSALSLFATVENKLPHGNMAIQR